MCEGGLALTMVYADVERGGNTGTPTGRWEGQLLNMEGASNGTAQQQWAIMGDGTIRLATDKSRCLVISPGHGAGEEGGGGLTLVDYDHRRHSELSFRVGSAVEMLEPSRHVNKAPHSHLAVMHSTHGHAADPSSRRRPASLEERFSGLLLCLLLGDSLASPTDGWTASETNILHPMGVRMPGARQLLDQPGVDYPPGHLTDRGVLALALASSLL